MGITALAAYLSFEHGQRLWLLWLALLPAVAAYLARRAGRRVPLHATILQTLTLASLAAALAGPAIAAFRQGNFPCLLLRDVSGSVRGQERTASPLAAHLPEPVEEYGFARGLYRLEGHPLQLPPAQQDQTNIAPALELALARSREGLSGVIIATDGNFSDDFSAAAAALAATNTPLKIVPLDAPPPDARIAQLQARRIQPGAVELAVTVAANASARRMLTVRREGEPAPLLQRELVLLPESPATIRLEHALPPDRSAIYRAELSPPDDFPKNDAASCLVFPARQQVAVVQAQPLLDGALAQPPWPLASLTPQALEQTPIEDYAAIIVADDEGTLLSPQARWRLGQYVRQGGGLVMVGTGPADGPAAEQDPLNQVLGLLANAYQRRPLSLRVVLDRSGSMALTQAVPGRSAQAKFDLAAEATLALKEHLTPRDHLAVVAFADSPEVIYDSGQASPDFAQLRDRLKPVKPGGSTRVIPAIREALSLKVPPGSMPMLLVLSDLETEQFDPQAWADNIRQASAQLAVVAVGGSTSAPPGGWPLETLARLQGAPYVRQDDLAGLARIFGSLVHRGRGSPIQPGPRDLQVVAEPFGSGLRQLPPAHAYILSAAVPTASVLAQAGGDAVLASRRAGLGRTVSLALPPSKNLAWLDDPSARRLLQAAVNWTGRQANDPRVQVELSRRGRQLRISAVLDQPPANPPRLEAQVAWQDQSMTLPLEQVSPAGFVGTADLPLSQPAAVVIRLADDGKVLWTGGEELSYAEEFRRIGADRPQLQRLADATGGQIIQPQHLGQELSRQLQSRLTPLWPAALGLALALALLEWCLVRISRR